MRLKDFESLLQKIEGFGRPKVNLEQYETPAHLASHLLYSAETNYGDLSDKVIVDLGCGCGMLSIGCAILGASQVIGLDVDEDALEVARKNIENMLEDEDDDDDDDDEEEESEDEDKEKDGEKEEDEKGKEQEHEVVQLYHKEVRQAETFLKEKEIECDCVVMNPPFGTKTKGIDMVFLEEACKIAKHTIYSLHKSSTRDYIERRIKSWGFEGQVLAVMKYDLPKTMSFHKEKSVDIEVDVWRFVKKKHNIK